jgi:CheY-like chemotaxis protein
MAGRFPAKTDPDFHTFADTASINRLLQTLIGMALVRSDEWNSLPALVQEELSRLSDSSLLLGRLVQKGLLTQYQADRISKGAMAELILGNYRVLDFLGSGAMSSVFKAEHRRLHRPVAIKVITLAESDDPRILERFFNEMWIVAHLQHPNIVVAFDAGELPSTRIGVTSVQYLVMEYIPGQDLEQYVNTHGPLDPSLACDLIYQTADALDEAHQHHLIHRDIKPSNIRVTPEGQSKLVDFGVARHRSKRNTDHGQVVGSVAYLAPEQALDSRSVDIRADIYALGGTLFWCLTGQLPFAGQGNVLVELARRARQPPPSARALRPELAPELDAVVAKMMATSPADRYPTAKAVMKALMPFLRWGAHSRGPSEEFFTPESAAAAADRGTGGAGRHRILIVDDEPACRRLCKLVLEAKGFECDDAGDGKTALQALGKVRYDLIVLDVNMPGMTGVEVLRCLRAAPPFPHLKVIMASGCATADEMALLMHAGADDFLAKPFSTIQLQARISSALRLKDTEERLARLQEALLATRREARTSG